MLAFWSHLELSSEKASQMTTFSWEALRWQFFSRSSQMTIILLTFFSVEDSENFFASDDTFFLRKILHTLCCQYTLGDLRIIRTAYLLRIIRNHTALATPSFPVRHRQDDRTMALVLTVMSFCRRASSWLGTIMIDNRRWHEQPTWCASRRTMDQIP